MKANRARPTIRCGVCHLDKPWDESGAYMCNACFDSRLPASRCVGCGLPSKPGEFCDRCAESRPRDWPEGYNPNDPREVC